MFNILSLLLGGQCADDGVHDLVEAGQAKGHDAQLVDAAVQIGLCLGHKAFGLPQTVADPAVVGLGLHVPGFVVVPVLDEVVAQADDVGQLLFCGAHRLNGGVQPGVGGFQLLDVLLCLKALVSACFADGGAAPRWSPSA